MGSQSEECLELCVGWTSQHFKSWQVQLNLEKSALLRNDLALDTDEAHSNLAALATKDNAKLLGVDTGWKSIGPTLETRFHRAMQLWNRVQILRLPQSLFRRVATTYIVPVLFGVEFAMCEKQCKSLDNMMWKDLFGKSRTAANRQAAMALCFSSHITTSSGKRWMDLFRSIWDLAATPEARPLLLELWHGSALPRRVGLWSSWIHCLRELRMQLTHGGGVRFRDSDEVLLHKSQDRVSWLHVARHLWRRYQLQQANSKLPDKYPNQLTAIDWQCTLKPLAARGAYLDTVQANGVNTLDRCRRHFGDECQQFCEYGCPEPDTWSHRLLRCEGCRALRADCHLGDRDCEVLQDPSKCLHHTLIWFHPEQCRAHLWRISEAWGLWPSQEWLDSIMQWLPTVSQHHLVQLRYRSACNRMGIHTMLQRHRATVHFEPPGLQPLSARAVKEAYPAEAWQAETLVLAALIAVFHQNQVHVHGLQVAAGRLWHLVQSRKISNPHLRDLHPMTAEVSSDPDFDQDGDLQLPPDVVQAWTTSFEVAKKAAKFCDGVGDLFPLAKDFSRHRGFVRGGSVFPLSSGWMGDPLSRLASRPFAPSLGFLVSLPGEHPSSSLMFMPLVLGIFNRDRQTEQSRAEQTQSRHRADTEQTQSRHRAGTEQTQSRHRADTEQTQSRHRADTEQTQSRHRADTEQTQSRHRADTEQTQSRHRADTEQTEQTDRQTERRTDKQTDRKTLKQTNSQTERRGRRRKTERERETEKDRETRRKRRGDSRKEGRPAATGGKGGAKGGREGGKGERKTKAETRRQRRRLAG